MYKKSLRIFLAFCAFSTIVFADTPPNDSAPKSALRPGAPTGIPGWAFMGTAPQYYRVEYGLSRVLPVSARENLHGASIEVGGGSWVNGPGGNPALKDSDFATLMQSLSADKYRGKRMRLSAMLGTEKVWDGGRAGLWMRVDDVNGKVVAFDNMESRPITQTRDWKRYDVVLDVPVNAADIAFGFLLVGKHGAVSAGNFKFEVVDSSVPVTSSTVPVAAASELPKDPVNLDFSAQ